ncbi:MAG: hypothetical protein LBS58_00850 [Coriobacteriales bacterium]|jgi:hypothetical protein|nr:hypothetical protein [Coriobacteriales bacterium]
MVHKAVSDPKRYATGFGYAGTYFDYLKEIAEERGTITDLINLSIAKDEVATILKEAGFKDYRFDGALAWIAEAIELLKSPPMVKYACIS